MKVLATGMFYVKMYIAEIWNNFMRGKKMTVKVSVILPVYNVEKYLKECWILY